MSEDKPDLLKVIEEYQNEKLKIEENYTPLKYITRPNIESKPGIYAIFNLKNNFVYIGQSQNILHRLKAHYYNLKNNTHNNQYFRRDFRKFGFEVFFIQILQYIENYTFKKEYSSKLILDDISKERLNQLEAYYLEKFLDKGYKIYNAGPLVVKILQERQIAKTIEKVYPDRRY